MPPIIGAAILFIMSEPAPVDHMIGTSPNAIVATVMNFGRNRLTAPSRTACRNSARLRRRPFLLGPFVGEIEIEEHENPGLRIDSQQGDKSDPDSDTHIIAEQINKPHGADRREGDGQDDDEGLGQESRIDVQEEEDQEQGQGHDHAQPFFDPRHRLIQAGPEERVSTIPGVKKRLDELQPGLPAGVRIDVQAGEAEGMVMEPDGAFLLPVGASIGVPWEADANRFGDDPERVSGAFFSQSIFRGLAQSRVRSMGRSGCTCELARGNSLV